MKEFTYKITDPIGIHARPAGMLAKKAAELDSTVTIIKDGKSVDTRRLMALMQLGIKENDEITVRIEGGNEDRNAHEILTFLESNKY
ncbi:MAG: HPr family phosphocarrier protein [Clostridiales bacterium]|nr:HPr family phosphocarrier protein [Clostridiales bacterium]